MTNTRASFRPSALTTLDPDSATFAPPTQSSVLAPPRLPSLRQLATAIGAPDRPVDVRTTCRRIGSGVFSCPTCAKPRGYTERAAYDCVYLLGRSVLRLRRKGGFIECDGCASCFYKDMLQAQRLRWVRPHHLVVARRVMVLMMCADGSVEPAEVSTMIRAYERLGGGVLEEKTILGEVRNAAEDGRRLVTFLADAVPMLNPASRMAVLRCAYEVARADGAFHDAEIRLLRDVARALEITRRDIEAAK